MDIQNVLSSQDVWKYKAQYILVPLTLLLFSFPLHLYLSVSRSPFKAQNHVNPPVTHFHEVVHSAFIDPLSCFSYFARCRGYNDEKIVLLLPALSLRQCLMHNWMGRSNSRGTLQCFPVANSGYGEVMYGDGCFSGLHVLPSCKSTAAFFSLTIKL